MPREQKVSASIPIAPIELAVVPQVDREAVCVLEGEKDAPRHLLVGELGRVPGVVISFPVFRRLELDLPGARLGFGRCLAGLVAHDLHLRVFHGGIDDIVLDLGGINDEHFLGNLPLLALVEVVEGEVEGVQGGEFLGDTVVETKVEHPFSVEFIAIPLDRQVDVAELSIQSVGIGSLGVVFRTLVDADHQIDRVPADSANILVVDDTPFVQFVLCEIRVEEIEFGTDIRGATAEVFGGCHGNLRGGMEHPKGEERSVFRNKDHSVVFLVGGLLVFLLWESTETQRNANAIVLVVLID